MFTYIFPKFFQSAMEIIFNVGKKFFQCMLRIIGKLDESTCITALSGKIIIITCIIE